MKKKGRLKGFVKKHKILTVLICCILVIAITAGTLFAVNRTKSSGASYSFVRTTVLAKGTLEDTVSATGTVSSAKASNVTSQLNYTVKEINVEVGDTVKEGDVILTLNTSELESKIEKEKENIEKAKENAQKSYDNAKSSYDSAKSKLDSYKSTLSSAKSAYNSAKTPYEKAKSSISSYQSAYETALENYNNAGAKYVSYMNKYNSAVSGYKKGTASSSKLQSVAREYLKAIQNYSGGCSVGSYNISDSSSASSSDNMSGGMSSSASSSDSVSVTKTAADLCNEVVSTVNTLTGATLSVPSGSNTLYKLSQKAEALRNAKNSSNYASLESAYTEAKSAYNEAKQTYSQYENELSQAESQLSSAKEELSNASSSDTLEELESQLEDCSLKAEQDGTVTALNATVGSVCMDTAATIQDLSSLQVDITIEEADINNVEIGLACHITSDASDEVLSGTLTQIDPVSNNGSFGATVTVDSETSALHIGMNASVDIIVSSEEDVYQVPIDAVGTNGDTKYVYRKTSGEGTDMQFEQITVTTGESNDYYIEISSAQLSEGDVIRSSADLTEGIETVSQSSKDTDSSGGLFSSLFGGGNRGGMPDGGGQMPDRGMRNNSSSGDGMGSPPSGGMPGGNNG